MAIDGCAQHSLILPAVYVSFVVLSYPVALNASFAEQV